MNLAEYNRSVYNLSSFLDGNIGCGEDVDIALSSLELAKKLRLKTGYLKEITAEYRIHDLSLAEIRDQKERAHEENTVLRKHFGKVGTSLQHLKRLIARPECYFQSLLINQLAKRKRVEVVRYPKYG